MICKKCNTANAEGTMFCTNCGAILEESAQYQPCEQDRPMPAKGVAKASLVFGILALVGTLCCGLGLVPAIVGIITACVAKKKGNTGKAATAGLIMSIIAAVISIIIFVVLAVIFIWFGVNILAYVVGIVLYLWSLLIGVSSSSYMYY